MRDRFELFSTPVDADASSGRVMNWSALTEDLSPRDALLLISCRIADLRVTAKLARRVSRARLALAGNDGHTALL